MMGENAATDFRDHLFAQHKQTRELKQAAIKGRSSEQEAITSELDGLAKAARQMNKRIGALVLFISEVEESSSPFRGRRLDLCCESWELSGALGRVFEL